METLANHLLTVNKVPYKLLNGVYERAKTANLPIHGPIMILLLKNGFEVENEIFELGRTPKEKSLESLTHETNVYIAQTFFAEKYKKEIEDYLNWIETSDVPHYKILQAIVNTRIENDLVEKAKFIVSRLMLGGGFAIEFKYEAINLY